MRQPRSSGRTWWPVWAGAIILCVAAAGIHSGIRAQGGSVAGSVTFAKDVAPILQEKCEVCHRAEGTAPMSLATFEEVRPWAKAIRAKVSERQMPPWYVDKTVGIQKFADDRSLNDSQIETIVKWIDAGAPLGNPKDLPPKKQWPGADIWQLSTYFKRPPDLIVASPDYTMPAVSQDRWWEPIGDPAVPEDSWVAGTETRPTLASRKVVHHATTMLFQKESKTFTAIRNSTRTGAFDPAALYPSSKPEDPSTLEDPGPGGMVFNEWAVGKNGELYVEHDAGQFLRKGARIGWDIHMSQSGRATPVKIETAFWFYPKGQLPKYRAMMFGFGNAAANKLEIPPGQITRHEGYTALPAPAIIMNFQPHMHFRGKAFSMEAIYPDGRTEMLNHVSRYAFNWHINYVYAKDSAPVVPKGTIIKITGWHDNTAANRNNPDPSQFVTYGQRSVEEMMHANEVVIFITQDDYDRITAERRKNAMQLSRAQ